MESEPNFTSELQCDFYFVIWFYMKQYNLHMTKSLCACELLVFVTYDYTFFTSFCTLCPEYIIALV